MTTSGAEFTGAFDTSRGRWVIRRHGDIYWVLDKAKAHNATYVKRACAILNGET